MSYAIFDLDSCYCDGFYMDLEESKRMLNHHKQKRPFCVLVQANEYLANILNSFNYWIGYDSGTINNDLKNKMRLNAFQNCIKLVEV